MYVEHHISFVFPFFSLLCWLNSLHSLIGDNFQHLQEFDLELLSTNFLLALSSEDENNIFCFYFLIFVWISRINLTDVGILSFMIDNVYNHVFQMPGNFIC